MITIYHNPRCTKSRQTLALIEDQCDEINIKEYLKTPPSKDELTHIVALLGIQPLDLIRKNEADFKENFKDK